MVSNIQYALEMSFAVLGALYSYDWKHTHQKMTESPYDHGVILFMICFLSVQYIKTLQTDILCAKCTEICNTIIKHIVRNKKDENR